jgi:peptidoglycan hydrolase-like protein with peptidoglycan-binding domain
MVNHDSSLGKGMSGGWATRLERSRERRTVLRKTLLVVATMLVAAGCGGSDATETTTTTTVVFTSTSAAVTTSSTTTLADTTTTAASVSQSATATTYRVQLDLKALGLFDGQVDGIAGEQTQSALKAFQTQQGIPADGEFGPQTDALLTPLLIADQAYVEDLQDRLTELGVYTGPIDGDYGKGTKAAVSKVQASCELEETGTIDIATRICIDEA